MNISNLDLRHLRYFLAVAEELNFSRAAERLHISQPPLSHQIKELEQRLDTILFRRTKRKVVLTEAGLELMPRVQRLLRDLHDDLHAVQAAARGQKGELRIATIFSAPLAPAFARTVQTFKAAASAARLVFREMLYAQQIKALIAGNIDAALTWQIAPLIDRRLKSYLLADDELHICLPANHASAQKKSLTISDIAADTIFVTSLQSKMSFIQDLNKLAHAKSLSLNISQEASHFPIIANLVAAGCGIGILPDYIAQLATSKIVRKRLKGIAAKSMRLKLAMLCRADDENPLLKKFIASLEP